MPEYQTARPAPRPDAIAPDGSEIRFLTTLGPTASTVHCTLPADQVTIAVRHRTVQEVWWIVQGRGHLWRRDGDHEDVIDLAPGMAVTIPLGIHFQFRNVGDGPLRFVITTIPAWPGPDEAEAVAGRWEPTVSVAANATVTSGAAADGAAGQKGPAGAGSGASSG